MAQQAGNGATAALTHNTERSVKGAGGLGCCKDSRFGLRFLHHAPICCAGSRQWHSFVCAAHGSAPSLHQSVDVDLQVLVTAPFLQGQAVHSQGKQSWGQGAICIQTSKPSQCTG